MWRLAAETPRTQRVMRNFPLRSPRLSGKKTIHFIPSALIA
jgi:hypothetical protein